MMRKTTRQKKTAEDRLPGVLRRAKTQKREMNCGDIKEIRKEFTLTGNDGKRLILSVVVTHALCCPKGDRYEYTRDDIEKKVEVYVADTSNRMSSIIYTIPQFEEEHGIKFNETALSIIADLERQVEFSEQDLTDSTDRRHEAMRSFENSMRTHGF